ncbi:MAG: pyridoxal 5'-phosphate synthase glutaminase subunit PdxT [Planctomycetes bacterium]|nr:pyridoxal 5'-phosphate synthase glutaminase subunit PdxT [Planctomycetota bacterium]
MVTLAHCDGGGSLRAPVVGVLALQGDYAEHEVALRRHGIVTRRVRSVAGLAGLDGLVLPGGESTTMLRLLRVEGLEEPLGALLQSGRIPVLATCAGLILCAREVEQPAQRSYGVLDCRVARNGYGRQLHSGTVPVAAERDSELPLQFDAVFIRAPRVLDVGPRCRVLARRAGDPVLLEQGAILAACFHPELQAHHPVTERFVARVRAGLASGTAARSAVG